MLSTLKGSSTKAVCSLLLALLLVTLVAHLVLTSSSQPRQWLAASSVSTWRDFHSFLAGGDIDSLNDQLHSQRLYVEDGRPVHKIVLTRTSESSEAFTQEPLILIMSVHFHYRAILTSLPPSILVSG